MKRAKWIVIALVVVAVFLTAIIFMWNIRPRNRLAEYVAQLEAEGAVLEVADLRSTRPEGTTFYSGPIEESATAFLLSPAAAGPYSGVEAKDWPWYPIAEKAERVFELTPEEEAEVRAVVEENRDLVTKLKSVSELLPTPIEDIIRLTGLEGEIMTAKVPDLLACRAFARLLLLDAYVTYQDGRPDDALETCGHILQLAGHVRDIPGFLPRMASSAMTSTPFTPSASFLPRMVLEAEFSDQAVASFTLLLEQSVRREALAQSLDIDLLMGRQVFAQARRDYAGRVLSLPVRLALARDELKWLSVTHECRLAAIQPYHRVRDAVAGIDGIAKKGLWTWPLTELDMFPGPISNFRGQAQDEVHLAQAKIAFALNRYNRDRGSYPEKLSALVPAYLPEVPTDMFSGNEMPYFLADGSYVLYSTGWDGKDYLADYRASPLGREEVPPDELKLPPPEGYIWGHELGKPVTTATSR
jgi:hypothetical protein